ncbi:MULTISPECIES: DUF2171 domain-containing protein [Deinococcus]|jgi:Uncharacterized protein conserved in bacteria|uniref:DUF2171 domain-containing protein n=1 Tax=Deinococcus radiodurans (strain ATCC 13939 / DSM 20539 / JCM 16871 / CCUG 27074 / LMG 4051 / NBRC 15346 / NCIMB 9279 / VKM B-1422 / R1) TaxID=243230 RepID=Q9RUW9_DEIRA|nr:DUF2171 domain-containing protein [Deinococcus radiodurans]AAF10835.1 hypothetical protein DR_1261 [Deinococcus radiodurans R1 = ATCC 13939 = DSM 20539]QEM70734.1 DUF2171 domain-containing protein [Deinococcus radiodurans]QIP29315.1 DUF2171 domain-containing protein [Deinococcus radiodurans]QIP31990.1 DUF2171 domain-containing protein [Deinococcus radiodurans]UDL00385.1 DUF2171 domain-containing protein [Deinococcus radiodurans R1 = ATCC 13939 = DSM 20539]
MTNDISGRIAEDLKNRLAQEGEHLQVKDKDGEHVGTVDHFDGNQLKLTRDDSTDGQHHYVALSQVESMDNVAVYLNVSRNDIK